MVCFSLVSMYIEHMYAENLGKALHMAQKRIFGFRTTKNGSLNAKNVFSRGLWKIAKDHLCVTTPSVG